MEVDRRIFVHCTILQQSVHIDEQCSPRLINTTILIADMTVLESMAKLNDMSNDHRRQYHLRQLHPARSRRTDNVEDPIQELKVYSDSRTHPADSSNHRSAPSHK